MTTALEVLRYINEQHHPLGEVQYQKFLYYVQAWSLAWDGQPMFDDDIEAWVMGPVVPSVRHCGKVGGSAELSDEEKAKIDAVVAYYQQWSGNALIDKTHRESPWLEARGSLPADSLSREKISHDSMRREFTRQSMRNEGPQRPAVRYRDAKHSEALALASLVGDEWSRTLALLAR